MRFNIEKGFLLSRFSTLLLPVLLLIIAMASIQGGASLAKSLFPVVGASGTTALRLSMGTLILLLIFKPWRMKLAKGSGLSLLAYGLALGGMNSLFYLSLRTIPLGIAVALEFTGPLVLALLSSRRGLDFLWVVLAMLGLIFLLPIGSSLNHLDPLGVACALGAGACWALYIISGKKAGADNGTGTVAMGSLIAALIFCPWGFITNRETFFTLSIFDTALLPIALGVAILSTALPYTLEIIALGRLPARTFSTLMSLEPALGAISGMIFLNEYLTPTQWMALGAIIIASVGVTLTVRPRVTK